jgi:superfamily II DNA/RNA helicase
MIISARTGQGKTLCFLLPLLQHLLANIDAGKDDNETTYSLIMTPTRELALQIK